MQELISNNLWKEIKRISSKSRTRRAAIAYVTTDDYVKFGKGDTLIVDASDSAIASGQTNAKVLAKAHKRGASIFSIDGLHAKVMLLDRTTVIGSANLSPHSADSLIEAAVISDHPTTVSSVSLFIEQLARMAMPVDAECIERMLSTKVSRHWRASSRRRKAQQPRNSNPRTWLVAVTELDEDAYPEEIGSVEAGEKIAKERKTVSTSNVCPIRWTGRHRFMRDAREGDIVIQMWKVKEGAYPFAVYKHSPILYRQDTKQWSRFYIECFQDEEKAALSWKGFLKLCREVNFPRKISPNSNMLVPPINATLLHEYWDK